MCEAVCEGQTRGRACGAHKLQRAFSVRGHGDVAVST